MHEPRMTITGHLAAVPRLRISKQGHSVADFRVAHTPRVKLDQGWVDGETIWFNVTVWRGLAEHVASSIKKGDRVIVEGRLAQRTWTDDKGQARTNLEIDADCVGIDLMFNRATSHRTSAPPVEQSGAPAGNDEGDLVSSGQVDPETGEVLMVTPGGPEDGTDLDDELADLETGELVPG